MDIPLVSYMDGYFRMQGFQPLNTDNPAGGAGPNYTAFINLAGQYYILKETIAGDVSTFAFYAKILTAGVFATDWTGRAGLTYQPFNLAFAGLA